MLSTDTTEMPVTEEASSSFSGLKRDRAVLLGIEVAGPRGEGQGTDAAGKTDSREDVFYGLVRLIWLTEAEIRRLEETTLLTDLSKYFSSLSSR